MELKGGMLVLGAALCDTPVVTSTCTAVAAAAPCSVLPTPPLLNLSLPIVLLVVLLWLLSPLLMLLVR